MKRGKDGEPTAIGRASGRRARTVIVTGSGASVAFTLDRRADVVIGRDPSVDLFIDDASLSRSHARLRVRGDEVTLEDLGSKNGTRVAGRTLAKGEEAKVGGGASAELGAVMLMVLDPETEPARAPRSDRGSDRDHRAIVTDALAEIDAVIQKVAVTDLPVLLLGETGVGKDLFADRIHALSRRAAGPLVRIHAAALAESLFESELFGHVEGAFTGASRAKVGLLEAADGGTAFIDEVGELPPSIQVKFLRVLEDKRVQRVGAVTSKKIDVRFLAATNRDLAAEVERGAFRQDLFHRLRGVCVRIPPLRERRADIPVLASALLRRVAPKKRLSDAALRALGKHPFWGNVRELYNVIERSALLARADEIGPADLVFGDETKSQAGPSLAPGLTDEQTIEARRIAAALEKTKNNQSAAADLLGMSRRSLVYKLSEYGLPRPRKPGAKK